MLDNLKLGYGGTKTEMERLIADAAALTDVQKELNITVNEGDTSFANIVNAISVVQSNMGIMGTTAKEAATTISGSLNSMEAAWQNLLTGIADENANFDELIDNMVETVVAFGGNIIPRIEVALGGIGELIGGLLPKVAEAIPNLIQTVLPTLADAAVNLIKSFVTSIEDNYEMIINTVVTVATTIVMGLLDVLPTITGVGNQMVLSLIIGISKQLPTLLPAAVECVVKMVEALISPESISMLIDAAVELIIGLTIGLQKASMTLSLLAPELLIALIEGLLALTFELNTVGVQLMKGLWEGMKGMDDWLWEKVKEMLNGLTDKIKDFFGIKSPSKLFKDEIGIMLAKGLGIGFSEEMSNVEKTMQKDLNHLTDGLSLDSSITYDSYGESQGSPRMGGRSVSVVQNIYSQKQTAADLMQEAQWNAERAVYMGV